MSGGPGGDANLFGRLTEYLELVTGLRGDEPVDRTDLLFRIGSIDGRTFRADLDLLDVGSSRPIRVREFESAIRRMLRQLEKPKVQIALPNLDAPLTGAKDLLKSSSNPLASYVKESAYELSSSLTTHLDGHGLVRDGRTAFPHQLETARKILHQFGGNVIVADEVGLGKTITAGLVIADLILVNPGATILVLVPSNLTRQWADELQAFFGFNVGPRSCRQTAADLANNAQLLLAVDRAKNQDYARILAERRWDWLILDEAHEVRNPDSERARFIFSLNAVRRLYLTATPVHNSAYDIYHVVNSIRPGYLGTRKRFAEDFLDDEGGIRSPSDLQEVLSNVMVRTRRADTILRFPQREIEHVSVEKRQEPERQLYDDVLRLLRGIYRRHLGTAVPVKRASGKRLALDQAVLVAMLILKELGSHPRAALKSLEGALRARVVEFAKVTGDTSDLEDLDRILKSHARTRWERGTHKKTDTLLQLLPKIIDQHGKVVIYVQFVDTKDALLELISSVLDRTKYRDCVLVEYHGGLDQNQKDEATRRFYGAPRGCLVSTDAGGTGLNLQTASAVVNFDFPWNPMTIEQRIGRIDRIGQQASTVTIYNLISRGTIEMYVYAVLQEKLDVCHDILGDMESPLVAELMRRPEEFGIGNIVLGSADDEEMSQKFDALMGHLDMRRKQYGWTFERPVSSLT